MTTYEDLVAATLAHGTLPTVVPELKTITLGGAAAGVGIEASSFRYGLVHEALIEFDVLTGGGRVLTCRPDNEHRNLFYGFPNSYGTLGYALGRLKVRAIAPRRTSNLNIFDTPTWPATSRRSRISAEAAPTSSTGSHRAG